MTNFICHTIICWVQTTFILLRRLTSLADWRAIHRATLLVSRHGACLIGPNSDSLFYFEKSLFPTLHPKETQSSHPQPLPLSHLQPRSKEMSSFSLPKIDVEEGILLKTSKIESYIKTPLHIQLLKITHPLPILPQPQPHPCLILFHNHFYNPFLFHYQLPQPLPPPTSTTSSTTNFHNFFHNHFQ